MSTLAELRTLTRRLVNDQTATISEAVARFSNADITLALQTAEEVHYQDIVDASEDYFLVASTFWVGPTYQTSSKDVYKLPTDCDRIRLIESVTNNGIEYTSAPVSDITRNKSSEGNSMYRFSRHSKSTGPYWTIVGDNYIFEPSFTSNEQLRLWYISKPDVMSSSTDSPWGSHDNLSSHTRILAYSAGVDLLNSKEADSRFIYGKYRELRKIFISGVSQRNASKPQAIRDVIYGD